MTTPYSQLDDARKTPCSFIKVNIQMSMQYIGFYLPTPPPSEVSEMQLQLFTINLDLCIGYPLLLGAQR